MNNSMNRRLSRSVIAIASATISAVLVAACGSSGSSGGSGASGGSNVLKIGMVAEETGALQAEGASFVRGMQVAVNQVNAKGVQLDGKTYTLQMDICNDNSDQTQVSACATKLVQDDGDKIIFGGLSYAGPIVRGVTEANHAIYVSTGSAVAALMPESKYVIDASPALSARSKMGVEGIEQAFPDARKIAFLGGQDATTTQAFAGYKAALLAAGHGFQIVGTEQVPSSITDFSSLLTKLKSSNPDLLIIVAPAEATEAAMIQENAQLNVAPNVWLTSGVCGGWPSTPGRTVGANTSTGVITTGAGVTPAYTQYITQYYKLTSPKVPNPDPYAATALYAYDFVGIMAQAIEKAGTATDTNAILKAVNGITYNGMDGKITIADNQATYGQVMCTAENGSGAITNFKVQP
jgi:branched-chain amino acid transport system substrate-binding protein